MNLTLQQVQVVKINEFARAGFVFFSLKALKKTVLSSGLFLIKKEHSWQIESIVLDAPLEHEQSHAPIYKIWECKVKPLGNAKVEKGDVLELRETLLHLV